MLKLKTVALFALVLVVGLYFIGNKGSDIPPVSFGGEIYYHVDTSEVNKVVNYFLTPGGESPEKSAKLLQVSYVAHPDLTPRHVDIIRSQIMSTMDLSPLYGQGNKFFGMFRGRHPIYAVQKQSMFIIYSNRNGRVEDETLYRTQADGLLDEIASLSIGL